ncbi:LexA family protein [Clostridium felsineum]|uniref:LexA repressor n=1 Tax=Clostridium felsineum TaxID=36839 RepID=A0A1S8MBC5_9CLOT|nr:LexA family transcriptional regulator [Clostridium felsineum]URZ06639.1 LexA repressor [Clostridium felsineum]URZ11672.1 LexA repressor [Clostridium felsineum]
MKLTSIQNNIAEDTKNSFILVKGKKNTGKNTVAACRSIFLKNNYCISREDKILIINSSKKSLNEFKNVYSAIYENANFKYTTLLEPERDVIKISTLDDVIDIFSNIKVITEKESSSIIEQCINELKNIYPDSKILNNKYIDFLKEEIEWIKSSRYDDINVYQNIIRTGRNSSRNSINIRLNRNSLLRECIFKIMLLYNDKLTKYNRFDSCDKIKLSIKNIGNKNSYKFTHIIVNGIENFTKLEIDFVNSLRKKEKYSTMLCTYNSDSIENSSSWFINKKNIKLINKNKIKNYNLKNSYYNDNITDSLEKFIYKDIKHKTIFNFERDNYEASKIILTGSSENIEYAENEIAKLPVYNEIAAGEPIFINSQIEDKFYLPKYWVRGAKDCFILKIKGDSMINADINDGDYVVIKKTGTAEDRDIVAVNIDGSATLKRLRVDKSGVTFMPENELYSPIKVTEDEQVMLIGIAVGILKIN